MNTEPPDAYHWEDVPAIIATTHFSETEYARRLALLRTAMAERELSCLLITSPEDIYYLTGLSHQGYFAFTLLVVPQEGPMVIVARAMESATISAQAGACVHEPFSDGEDPSEKAAEVVLRLKHRPGNAGTAQTGIAQIGVEFSSMFFPISIWEGIRSRIGGLHTTDASDLVPSLREVKSAEELHHVRAAAEITSTAMEAGLAAVTEGAPESSVAEAISSTMIRAKSEHPGFVPLVRSRERLLHEHVSWQDRRITAGDAVFMEFSASVARYHAPMSRMAYLGAPPPGTEIAAGIAEEGLLAVTEALRPGASGAEVYDAWQRVVEAGLGHSRYRRHHCGYMVGIGFPPSWVGGAAVVGLRDGGELEIREGMTFHVLSWLLDQEPADFVLSDTVVVTAEGGEVLTDAPRTPVIR